MRHVMSPVDFSVEELYKLLTLANDIEKNPEKYARTLLRTFPFAQCAVSSAQVFAQWVS